MEPMLMPGDRDRHRSARDEDLLVHAWRVQQLRQLGLPAVIAETFADLVDRRAVAALVERGCPAGLALEIVR